MNASAWEHERAGLQHIKTLLPDADPYWAWSNLEFVAPDGSVNEVDLLVLTPSGLYLVELKHWQGDISGDGIQWVLRSPNGRTRREDNPLILANRKAKRLASLLHHYAPQSGRRARVPFVRAAIFLHGPRLKVRLDQVGRQGVHGLPNNRDLPHIADLLTRKPTDVRDLVDRTRAREIKGLIDAAGLRPSVADRTVLQLHLKPGPYAEGPGWQDFLAQHKVDTTIVRRVRFYLTSKAGPDDRDIIQRAAEREFRLLQGIHHPGIAHATDLVDHELGPAVIFEHDPDAVRFDHWLAEHGDRLTVDDRLNLVRELAEIVRYAYSRHLVHRGLNPRSILVCDPDKNGKPNPDRPNPRLVVTDWQTGGRAGTSTTPSTPTVRATGHIDHLADDMARLYQAPELATSPEAPGHLLDVFALGALTYLIFTGRPPAETPAQLQEAIRERGGLELTAAVDGVPDTLAYLIQDATAGDTQKRTQSATKFLEDLEVVEEELTAPEPGPVIDPLEARVKDVLDGGFVVDERLGSGATAVALKVHREGDDTPLVLKVARDEDKRQRLYDEAKRLAGLRHFQVAQLVAEPRPVGGRTALLLDFAGAPTLAEELRANGRLSLELLERYGHDLLDIARYLDGQGVIHRDIKPANLAARPRPKDRRKHLCVFDFSLASTPADEITAGTPPYLDPFLGPPHRPRFDGAAERFAVAVTLYEMATGTLPRWGDGIAHPAAIPDEVTITPEVFDPAVADRLGDFFARALARDAADRFDTIEEMADAWRSVFRNVGAVAPGRPATERITRATPLDLAGLTAHARSALERLGVRTVGDLVDHDAMALSRQDGIPQATKGEIRRTAKELRALVSVGPEAFAEPAAGPPRARSVDSLVELLVPRQTTKNRTEVAALRVMLGLEPAGADGRTFLHWPTQVEVAHQVGMPQPQLSRLMATRARRWAANEDLAEARDEIVELLGATGGVMSAVELAQALIASRGTYATEPRRTAQGVGLVHAAVEAELSRASDARLGIRKCNGGVLIAREPDDPTASHTREDLLRYAVQLGRVAQKLADADSLPPPARAIERLRQVTRPPAMPELSDSRLVQLAAAAGVRVAVNSQLQIYPEGMAAERALRLAAGSLVLPRGKTLSVDRQTLSVDQLRKRVESRFPRAASLPERPTLDRLLAACGIALEWDHKDRVYRPPAAPSGSLFATPTRAGTLGGRPPAGAEAVSEAQTRIVAALDRDAFLALLVTPSDVTSARRALLDKLPVSEVDVTRVLVETLRSVGVPWELVITSDGQPRTHPDRRNLENAVRHAVLPRITAAIDAAPGAVLLSEAAPLARYDCMDLIARLADNASRRPAARLLLVAARRAQPVLDTVPIPVTAAQWMWLPEAWYSASPYSPSKDNT